MLLPFVHCQNEGIDGQKECKLFGVLVCKIFKQTNKQTETKEEVEEKKRGKKREKKCVWLRFCFCLFVCLLFGWSFVVVCSFVRVFVTFSFLVAVTYLCFLFNADSFSSDVF